MPWVYLDDKFDQHPKVVEAGSDASWMFVASLCWSNRNLTAGRIPKSAIRLLTDKRPGPLVERLVAVNLWETSGEGYLIHDYEFWNQTAKSMSDRAKKAARRRWDNEKERDAQASAGASAPAEPEQSSGNAPAHTPAPGPQPLPPTPEPMSSSTHVGCKPDRDDDDLGARLDRAADAIAALRLEAVRRDKPDHTITNMANWMASTTAGARADLDEWINADAVRRRHATSDEMVAGVMPSATGAAAKPHPFDGMAAAQAKRAEEGRARMEAEREIEPAAPDVAGSALAAARAAMGRSA